MEQQRKEREQQCEPEKNERVKMGLLHVMSSKPGASLDFFENRLKFFGEGIEVEDIITFIKKSIEEKYVFPTLSCYHQAPWYLTSLCVLRLGRIQNRG